MDNDVRPVRILHLEDEAADAELIGYTLRAALAGCEIRWVSNRAAFEAALADAAFDVVLCDYHLPAYDGLRALEFAHAHRPDLPVILLSGTLNEAEAVACVKAGATDYVLKDRPGRLGPSIRRALVEVGERRRRRETEAALELSEARLRRALNASQICVWDYEIAAGRVVGSTALGTILGYPAEELASRVESWEAIMHPADLRRVKAAIARHYRGKSPFVDIEYRVRARNGEWRWLHTIGRSDSRDRHRHAMRISGTHQDVTARRLAEETLRLRESAIAAATNAILIVDARAADRPIVYVNRAFEKITGYTAEEVIGRNSRFLQGDDRDQPDLDRLRQAISSARETTVLLRNYRKDGTRFWNNLTISPVRNDGAGVSHFVGVQSDVTELKSYEVELEYQATHDTLTGLANKNLLLDRVTHAVASGERSRRNFALLLLDLDRFKLVNDSLGHACGDLLLSEVARRLKAAVRESDTVARVAGDEFAIVIDELEHAGTVAGVAQKILKDLQAPFAIRGHELVVSASVGICIYPDEAVDAGALIKNASTAMFRAKHGGGGQVCFYTEEINANALERLQLETDLRRAVALDAFELHYQPRIDLGTGAVTSVEALIRWRHPEQGLIPPARFIPVAEEIGLIGQIGSLVLVRACNQARLWRDAGHTSLRVAVNLSPRQFRQPDLIASIRSALAQSGLEANQLELEVTEGVAMHDPVATQQVLEVLSKMGIAIAIDDFGTGYSSLGYLQRFPLDYLKIDQSFVRGIPGNAHDEHLVRSIIALAHNMGLGVIGEGVETEDQRRCLEAWGCDEAQGYLLCRPKPAGEISEILSAAARSRCSPEHDDAEKRAQRR